VGWEDREWAKWTDEERRRFLGAAPVPGRRRARVGILDRAHGRSELTLLAIAVSLAASLAVAHFHLLSFGAAPPAGSFIRPAMPRVVYGTGLSHLKGQARPMTCTAVAKDSHGFGSCTAWMIVAAGQRVVQAAPLPAGSSCSAVEADQHSGRWVCTKAQWSSNSNSS
jgi:hypothetical protein